MPITAQLLTEPKLYSILSTRSVLIVVIARKCNALCDKSRKDFAFNSNSQYFEILFGIYTLFVTEIPEEYEDNCFDNIYYCSVIGFNR